MLAWLKNRVLVTLAVLAVGALVVPFSTILGAVAAQDEETEVLSTLRIGFQQAVDKLNPNLGLNDASYVFYGLVYDNPHCVDDNGTWIGNLCVDSRPVPTSDPEMVSTGLPYGSVWEYNVTRNAYWHDGESFTVDDFIWNIEIQSNQSYYDLMWAFQPYTHFMKATRRVDDDTARIYYYFRTNNTPTPCAWGNCLGIPMVPKHKLGMYAPNWIGFTWSGVFEGEEVPIVGTGPFMATKNILEEWRAGERLTLVKNPYYHWGPDKGKYVKFDKVEMIFYDDPSLMRLALTSGDIDIAQFPPETYKAIKEGKFKRIATYDGPKITCYWTEIEFNMNAAGGKQSRLDIVIRQALAKATNKTYIVENYYRGLADEGTTLIPPILDYWHYEPTESEKFAYDLDAAAEMLDAAGYRYLVQGDPVRVCTADSWAYKQKLVPLNDPLQYHMMIREEYPEEKLIASYLESEWAKIGVDLNYEVMAESKMSSEVYYYTYDTCIWYWSSDVDPNYMLYCQSMLSWDGWSDNRYGNPLYEENYSASVAALDPAVRRTYVRNCQKIHYNDCAFIIMANVYQTYAWRTDTFTGYGDWSKTPGRSMDNFWTGNPLWFELEYIGDSGGGFDVRAAAITAGVVGAVVAVIAVLVWRRKKKREEMQETAESPLGQ